MHSTMDSKSLALIRSVLSHKHTLTVYEKGDNMLYIPHKKPRKGKQQYAVTHW